MFRFFSTDCTPASWRILGLKKWQNGLICARKTLGGKELAAKFGEKRYAFYARVRGCLGWACGAAKWFLKKVDSVWERLEMLAWQGVSSRIASMRFMRFMQGGILVEGGGLALD